MDISVGEILIMKKKHPCGGNRFQVLRVGMAFKLRCLDCGHEIMIPRAKAEKVFLNVFPKIKSRTFKANVRLDKSGQTAEQLLLKNRRGNCSFNIF